MSANDEYEMFTLAPGVLVEPPARRDAREIVIYLGRDDPRKGLQFLSALHQTLNELVEFPHIGSLRQFPKSQLHSVRQWPVRDFKNYLIFYRAFASGNGLEVLRVLHARRDAQTHLEATFDEPDEA